MSVQLMKGYTFRKTLLSYALIIIIPVIVFCCTIVKQTLQENQRNIIKIYENDAGRIRDAVDSRLIELNSIGGRLYHSKWIGKLTSDTSVFEKEFDIPKKLEISQELNNYMIFSRVISGIAVVFPYKDLVVSHNGWYNVQEYFKSVDTGGEDTFDSIYSNLLNYTYFKVIENQWKTSQEGKGGFIAVIQSMELHDKPRAVLLLFINKEYLTNYIKQTAGPSLNMLSISGENTVIYHNNFTYTPEAEMLKGRHLHFTATSNVSSWEYKFVYNNNYLPFQTQQLIPLLLSSVLSLAGGSLAAFFLARLTYKPLYKLFSKVFKQEDLLKTSKRNVKILNEYNIIEASFDKLIEEKETIILRARNIECAVFGVDISGNSKMAAEHGLYYYPTDWEIHLINNLKVGNFNTVTGIINEIKLENEGRRLSPVSMKRLVSLLMETIVRVLNELNINTRIYQKAFLEYLASDDIESTWLHIYEVCSHICDRNKHFDESGNIDLGEILLRYVNDNYSDSALSLKSFRRYSACLFRLYQSFLRMFRGLIFLSISAASE